MAHTGTSIPNRIVTVNISQNRRFTNISDPKWEFPPSSDLSANRHRPLNRTSGSRRSLFAGAYVVPGHCPLRIDGGPSANTVVWGGTRAPYSVANPLAIQPFMSPVR